ncbi:MAG: hypothetical protein IPJ77_12190 [Planctomycetes bacterium]|nr:hypothetical protein [Planctomycetota bacterium]
MPSSTIPSFVLAAVLTTTAHAQAPAAPARATPEAPEATAAERAARSPDDARTVMTKAARYLVKEQRKDGSWCSDAIETLSEAQFGFAKETWYCFKLGANGLAIQALLALEDTPEHRTALEKALQYFCTTRIPKRGNEWDVDYAWAAVEGFAALVAAAQDPRFQSKEWMEPIQRRGMEYFAVLESIQEPMGGWGYYEGPVVSRRPTWSTSFTTASVVPALVDAETKLRWPVDPKVKERAVRYIQRCALPNGAYEYDLNAIPRIKGGEHINNVKGSLGRIQVCNWARRRAGDASVTDDKLRQGLEAFFDHHKFLDEARLRPIPHEGYYAVAAYFYFFGHAYAGEVINLLPAAEREAWHQKLRAEIAKCQWKDGSFMDFLGSDHMGIAATSFSILALHAGLKPDAPASAPTAK